jgi:hypothetical protein
MGIITPAPVITFMTGREHAIAGAIPIAVTGKAVAPITAHGITGTATTVTGMTAATEAIAAGGVRARSPSASEP